MKQVILGTAGHIDHGKTELVKALTGVDTDRLKEEKERGISIDIGFAEFPAAPDLMVGVVDVPGHEAFIRNMLAGASGIDLVLLVVAADEGVMPQTIEHLEILDLLGVERGIIVLAKSDLVQEDWLGLVMDDVRQRVAGTFLEGAPLVAVSARTGAGIPDLTQAIVTMAREVRERRRDDLFRLPIDRVFTIHGVGTVITGTIWSGTIIKDALVRILPAGLEARVKGIEVHGTPRAESGAGVRTALALAGVPRERLARGETVVSSDLWAATHLWDVWLRYLADAGRPLRTRARVRVHLATREALGRVVFLEGPSLTPGGSGWAQLRLEEPMVARAGDRFVLRSYSPAHTIGGGIVLHPWARKRATLRMEEGEILGGLLHGRPEEKVRAVVASAGRGGIPPRVLLLLTDLPEGTATSAVEGLRRRGEVRLSGGVLMAEPEAARVEAEILHHLGDHHQRHPLEAGALLGEVRQRLGRGAGGAIDAILEGLAARGVVTISGGMIRLASHVVSLSGEEEEIAAGLLGRLGETPLAPPGIPELLAEWGGRAERAGAVLRVLERQGKVVRVGADLCFTRAALEEAWGRVADYLTEGGRASAGEIRDVLGTTRKFVIPLLEWWDREGLTRREGDYRALRTRSPQSNQ